MKIHTPVLLEEVIAYLDPKPNENFIDGTTGEGSHTEVILDKNGPRGRVLAIDLDPVQVEHAKKNLAFYENRVVVQEGSYAKMRQMAEKSHIEPINGILLDVGYSSWHIEGSKKGFSFMKDESLDMRYSPLQELTAAKMVNEFSQEKLEEIIAEYGEEKFARQIAKEIAAQRRRQQITTTGQLKKIIESVVPGKYQHGSIHCATRTFQALRIFVNGELDTLQQALQEAVSILSPGGRLVVISFHSLEDRIVKQYFASQEKEGAVTILTKKPVTASTGELSENPRSRSAKLRAIFRI